MAEQSGEKTEQPTPQKLNQAKKKGQIWKSKDLTSSIVLLGAIGTLAALGPYLADNLRMFIIQSAAMTMRPYQEGLPERALATGLIMFTRVISPIVGCIALVALLTEAVQARGVFTAEAVKPKFENVDPLKGLKNMFSKKQLVELLMSTFKLFVAGWICYVVLKGELGAFMQMMRASPGKSGYAVGSMASELALRITLVFLGLAAFDTFHQWRSYMKEMMMTREEVKQEYKQSEGDPQHKSQRKQLHQEILNQETVSAVRGSDVVVTNPEHIAVALKYSKDKDRAPKVVAKGQRVMAERIKALAKEMGIPVMRNVPLAHALLRIDVDQEIPEELYDAVAEVLNLVYALAEGDEAKNQQKKT